MERLERRAVRVTQMAMAIAILLMVLLDRIWLGQAIPQDLHPAATTAMLMAIGTLISWYFISTWEVIILGREIPSAAFVAGISASFFLSLSGLLIGVGESGCSAWIVTAAAIAWGLRRTWREALQEWENWWHRDAETPITNSMIAALFLVGCIAHFLNW